MPTHDTFAEFQMDGHNSINTDGAQNIGEGSAKTLSAYGASMVCLPYLEKSENASTTNSSSFSSSVPVYDMLPYATAKAALNQVMVSLANPLNRQVRVNSILIGTVVTAGYGDAGITPEMPIVIHPLTPFLWKEFSGA